MLHRRKGRCVGQKASPPTPIVLPSSGPIWEKGPMWGGGLGQQWWCIRMPSNEAGPSVSWRVGVGGQASDFWEHCLPWLEP